MKLTFEEREAIENLKRKTPIQKSNLKGEAVPNSTLGAANEINADTEEFVKIKYGDRETPMESGDTMT